MNGMKSRRVGIFEIPIQSIHLMLEVVQRIMARVMVVRAEMLYDRNAIEYTALSNDFEEVPQGHIPPRYEVMYDEFTDKLWFEKVEEGFLVSDELYLEGNKGGDYIRITQNEEQKDKNLCYLEVGSCCVKTIESVVPIEFITMALTKCVLQSEYRDLPDIVRDVMKGWPEVFVEERVSHIRRYS